jgi:hypothetical protein
MAAHVATGVLRVALPRVGTDDVVAGALQQIRRKAEDLSGTLRITRASPGLLERVDPWGDPGGARRLVEGIRGVFDPGSTLSPGRFAV